LRLIGFFIVLIDFPPRSDARYRRQELWRNLGDVVIRRRSVLAY
jgi:hypothetical protein